MNGKVLPVGRVKCTFRVKLEFLASHSTTK